VSKLNTDPQHIVGVRKKDEDKEWFLVGKNQLMKNATEFKATLGRRIKQEEITEKQ